jgi:hypothetical protein
VVGCLGLAAAASAEPVAENAALHEWRAARRAGLRERCLAVATAKVLADPAAAPARFGLLVIPVDFADRRLSATWDVAT